MITFIIEYSLNCIPCVLVSFTTGNSDKQNLWIGLELIRTCEQVVAYSHIL